MSSDKIRRRIAAEAARLIYLQGEPVLAKARRIAARSVSPGQPSADAVPSPREIRAEVQRLAKSLERESKLSELSSVRSAALSVMHATREFRPRLTGDALSGRWNNESRIELWLFADSMAMVSEALTAGGIEVEPITNDDVTGSFAPAIHAFQHASLRSLHSPPVRLHVFAAAAFDALSAARVNGLAIDIASIADLEKLIAEQQRLVEGELLTATQNSDCYEVFESLLWPLEETVQDVRWHPEGDALYHSLQVFDLAKAELPYDEAFLLAALLHDVGKAIDPRDHVAAGLEALEGLIPERTEWLIQHLDEAQQNYRGELSPKAARRLRQSESYEELMLLAKCDREGRVCGVETSDVHDALAYLRELADESDG